MVRNLYDGIIGVPFPIFWRIAGFTFALMAFALAYAILIDVMPYTPLPEIVSYRDDPLHLLAERDAAQELSIALHGYPDPKIDSAVYRKPPLFALLVRCVIDAGVQPELAIFLVHWLCVFYSSIWLYRLMLAWFPHRQKLALRTVMLYPFMWTGSGFFYLMSYHEPLFICFIFAILYHLHKGNDRAAGILIAVMFLSKTQAIGFLFIGGLITLETGFNNYRQTRSLQAAVQAGWRRFELLTLPGLMVFTAWIYLNSQHIGVAYAPLSIRESSIQVSFGIRKPLSFIYAFRNILNFTAPDFYYPMYTIIAYTALVLLISVFVLMRLLFQEAYRVLRYGVAYTVFIFCLIAFVGFTSMGRLIHATLLPLVWVLVTDNLPLSRKKGRVLDAVYIILCSTMTLILMHSLFIDSFGFLP